ncbi:MAG: MBL fold metallo-hydrolase, partial [Pseudoflavonifractor sp.]
VSDGFMGGLIAALVHFVFPPLGRALAFLVSMLIRYVQNLAIWLAAFPFAALPMGSLYLRLWFCGSYLILILYLLWRGEKKRPIIPLCACGLTLCAALLFTAAPQGQGALEVSILDVGQGQSVLLTSGDARALVDCGGNGLQDAGDVAATWVQKSGSNRLDLLVLTHYHADHANGVATLMARLEIAAIALPDVEPEEPLRAEILALAQAEGAEIIFIREDAHVVFGDASLKLYAPLGDGGANEAGLSILATAGSFDALMTGDMNSAVEKRLVKYGDLPDIELLIAGHHGSAHASSEELLMAVRPEYAVISVGHNSYGHPADAALERLAAAGCAIYRTDQMGTVTITSGGGD